MILEGAWIVLENSPVAASQYSGAVETAITISQ